MNASEAISGVGTGNDDATAARNSTCTGKAAGGLPLKTFHLLVCGVHSDIGISTSSIQLPNVIHFAYRCLLHAYPAADCICRP